jgi:membrane fusion protein, multidrug efflux system
MLLASMAVAALSACERQAAQTEVKSQPVRVVQAAISSYQPVAAITGQVEARIQTDIAFRVSGKVVERRVDVGAKVSAGEVLMRLDDSEQQSDLKIAQASVRAAEADVKQKTLAYQRYETLLEARAISQQVFDQAREGLTTSQASLDSAQANLETAQDALSYTVLKADAPGIVTARNIEVGTVVSAAQPVLTIARDGPRDVVFDVYEAFFLKGEPSQQVEVSPISNPGRKANATIREISPVIDPQMGTIRIRLTLEDDQSWPLGTPVVGAFLGPAQTGTILPWSAMSSENGQPAVWVVDAETRTASLKPVEISVYRSGDFIVSSGLSDGALVVSDGTKLIRPNEPLDWES